MKKNRLSDNNGTKKYFDDVLKWRIGWENLSDYDKKGIKNSLGYLQWDIRNKLSDIKLVFLLVAYAVIEFFEDIRLPSAKVVGGADDLFFCGARVKLLSLFARFMSCGGRIFPVLRRGETEERLHGPPAGR